MPPSSLLPGEIVRIRDERWVVTRQTPGVSASILDVRGRDRTNREARASFLLPFEAVERLASDQSPRRVTPGRWRRLTRALLTEATPSWPSLRTPLRARISLLPFQLEPALAVTHGMASRILIADEVGLGKTIQAALIIAEILERTRHACVLIVAPASLKEQWQSELHERFAIDAWIADSPSLARLGTAWGTVNPWVGRPVTITSIDFVKRPEVLRSLEALVWDVVVFDEAHGLTGRSDRAIAAGAVARRARTVVLLTATPHSGDDRAFDSLTSIGDLEGGFPALTFRRTRDALGLSVSRRTMTLRVRPTIAEQEMHRALHGYARKVRVRHQDGADPAHLAMMVLARRACSSASSLARSVERRLALLPRNDSLATPQMMLPLFDLSADEEPGAELSAPGLDDREEEHRWLERILLLARRAQSAESKLTALTRLLRRINEPAIVFTEYRDTLARVAQALHDLMPVTLHGALSTPERRESLRSFTSGNARLLLATDAASEGLNLQHRCRLVVNLEVPWTPLRVEQRTGRVERIGQERRVHAVHLVAAGTTEESYAARLSMRTGRVADALDKLRTQPPELLRLQATAHAEATRIERLRSLASSPANPLPESRPHVALVRRRTRNRGDVWAFHVEVVDSSRQLVCHTLVAALSSSQPGSKALALSVGELSTQLSSRLDDDCQKALASLQMSLRLPVELALRRERAIVQALEIERARLTATLVQRGLFDRRAERAFAAESAVLAEALSRCQARLDELAASTRLAAEPRRLAFVLIRR